MMSQILLRMREKRNQNKLEDTLECLKQIESPNLLPTVFWADILPRNVHMYFHAQGVFSSWYAVENMRFIIAV